MQRRRSRTSRRRTYDPGHAQRSARVHNQPIPRGTSQQRLLADKLVRQITAPRQHKKTALPVLRLDEPRQRVATGILLDGQQRKRGRVLAAGTAQPHAPFAVGHLDKFIRRIEVDVGKVLGDVEFGDGEREFECFR